MMSISCGLESGCLWVVSLTTSQNHLLRPMCLKLSLKEGVTVLVKALVLEEGSAIPSLVDDSICEPS